MRRAAQEAIELCKSIFAGASTSSAKTDVCGRMLLAAAPLAACMMDMTAAQATLGAAEVRCCSVALFCCLCVAAARRTPVAWHACMASLCSCVSSMCCITSSPCAL